MRKLPLVDLTAQYNSIKDEVDAAMRSVVESAAFVGGPAVRELEAAFAAFCDCAHVVSCGNGTDAISIALRGLGIGPGDEVITVPNTFIATAEAISNVGAIPVFVDVREDTLNLDETKVEDALTERTRSIWPVHYAGVGCEMDPILDLAKTRGLRIVEDAAQGVDARYRDWMARRGQVRIKGNSRTPAPSIPLPEEPKNPPLCGW